MLFKPLTMRVRAVDTIVLGCCALIASICCTDAVGSFNKTEWALVDSHLSGSGFTSPPYLETGIPVEVGIDVHLSQLSSVTQSEIDSTFLLHQTWHDPRLAISSITSNDYVSLKRAQQSSIWTPDIIIANEVTARLHLVTSPNTYIRLYPNGTVLRSMRLSCTLLCVMQLGHFPHDSQECDIRLISHSHPVGELSLKWSSPDKLGVHYTPDYVQAGLEIKTLTTDTCTYIIGFEPFSCLQIKVYMDREFHGFILRVYVPSFVVVILGWVSMWIDKDQVSARTSIGTLCVVAILTQSITLTITMPESMEILAVDVWMVTCMMFVSFALTVFATAHNLTRWAKRAKASAEKLKKEGQDPDEIIKVKVRRVTGGRVEFYGRILYAVAFVAFNIIYWLYFLLR